MEVNIPAEEKGALSPEDQKALDTPPVEGGDQTPPADPPQDQTPPTDPPQDQVKEQEDAAADALKVAGLEMSEFTNEWAEKGELSEDSFAKLEMAGFPRAVVETYIRGIQSAQAQNQDHQTIINDVYKHVGGEAEYQKMIGWAKANLSPTEQATYNNIVGSNDPTAIEWAVDGLKARYTNSVGKDPDLIKGGPAPAKGDVFESTYQVVEAMKDPRYGKDEAYTNSVAQKLSRSNVF